MNTFYIDGEFVPEERAVIPVNDMAVLRGYAVFDFLRTYNRRPFHLEAHIDRLARSARLIELDLPASSQKIAEITLETLSRNDHSESNIRLVATGGVSPDSITPQHRSRLMVMVVPLHTCPPEWYRDGAAVITTHDERYLPGAKSINYISAVLALARAQRQNAIESIYVDRYGRLLEGTTTNFFAFIGDRLVTPASSILPGVTRQVVLELVQDEFELMVRDIHVDEMRLMDEVFITASNKEIVPIVRMDHIVLGQGTPGPRTQRIMALFADYTKSYGEKGEGFKLEI